MHFRIISKFIFDFLNLKFWALQKKKQHPPPPQIFQQFSEFISFKNIQDLSQFFVDKHEVNKKYYYFQDFMKMKVFKILPLWKTHLCNILPRKM